MSEDNPISDVTRYTIVSKIGEGGFSKVYRIKDVETNKYYAAKVSNLKINEEARDSQEALLLFREINLMSLLNHPSVLKFIQYYSTNFEEDPAPTIVTELATNGSLRDIIRMEIQGLSPDEWDFTKKLINIYGIASGMSYLHSHNVLHRDLKPENILMNDYLHPKISDFGLSKITDFITNSMNIKSQNGLKGTTAYMAPEIFTIGKYSKSTDVYSFGFIVYEILMSIEPFQNLSLFQIIKKVTIDGYRPEFTDDIPKAYRDLIERCWSQDEEKRPSFDQITSELKTNEEFITDLVDESEFFDYIDFIENSKSSFDTSKMVIHFDDFIKVRGRRKNMKRISLDKQKFTEKMQNKEETGSNINLNKDEGENNSPQKIIEGEIIDLKKDEKKSEIESISQKVIENESIIDDNPIIYPSSEFNKLSEKNQKLVEEAKFDAEKKFEVGRSLIEGKNDFPKDLLLGIKYVKKSIDHKCIDALIYYIKLRIKGKFIPKNQEQVNEYFTKLLLANDKRIFLIHGIISYNDNKFSNAAQYFEEGSNLEERECMYQYGKLLFSGEGIERNVKEALKYLNKSTKLGFQKSKLFLLAFSLLNNTIEFSELPSETQLIFIKNNIKNNFNKILLQPRKTEKLFFNKSLKSPNFYQCLKLYKDISIEIEYTSESFKSILDLLIKIKSKNIENLKIGVIFTSLSEKFFLLRFPKEISYFKIDSSIQNIPPETFHECNSITEMIIPSSIRTISTECFYDCSMLKTIIFELSSSIISIEYHSFYKCSSLKEIIIPSSVTKIEEGAFLDCSSLTKIFIPSSVTSISSYAFRNCSSLTEISIPSSVVELEHAVISGCSSLSKISFPFSIMKIENNFFNRFLKETKIISIPSSMTSIGRYAFVSFNQLKKIVISPSVELIESDAFCGCSSLSEISMPHSICSIGSHSFFECISLTEIVIPSSVKRIDSNAFCRCTALMNVTFEKPSSVELIECSSFNECSALKQILIPASVIKISISAFEGCSSLLDVLFEDNSKLESIEFWAFCDCKSLKQIIIPPSIIKLDENAFYNCSSLKQITIPSTLNQKINVGLFVRVKKI